MRLNLKIGKKDVRWVESEQYKGVSKTVTAVVHPIQPLIKKY